MNERLNEFARNLKALMDQRGLSTEAISEISSVSQKTVNNVLNGRHATQTDVLERIASALDVPMWQLWLPQMPVDLDPGDTFPSLVCTAAKISPEARRQLSRIADLELAALERP